VPKFHRRAITVEAAEERLARVLDRPQQLEGQDLQPSRQDSLLPQNIQSLKSIFNQFQSKNTSPDQGKFFPDDQDTLAYLLNRELFPFMF